MVRFVRRAALACCLCLALLAQAQEDAERLRIHGSNTMGSQLMPALVERWLGSIGYEHLRRSSHGGGRSEIHAVRDGQPLVVEIDGGGSTAGLRDLVHGDTELAMVTRPPNAAEQAAAWQLGKLDSPDQQFVVALNGARVLVGSANPLRSLSVAQLREVLAGRIDSWRQLGGSDRPLQLVCADGAAGLADYLRGRVGALAPQACSRRVHSLRDAAAAVAGNPLALAVVEIATPLAAGTRALAIADGGIAVPADPVSVRSQDYPLAQRYSVHGGQMMSALGRSFALYLLGPAAQRIVAAQGLVPMALPSAAEATPLPDGSDPGYRDAVAGAVRLPLSVHFDLASLTTMFEGGSAQDLDRLVAWMQQPGQASHQLVVVAFANADPANKLFATIASNDRADIVTGYLAQRGVRVQRSRGLGALRPLVAADAPQARARNERVEVWLL